VQSFVSVNTSNLAMEERRTHPRRRILKTALVTFNEHRSTLPCTVRNMSDTGCSLEFDWDFAMLPERFALIIEVDGQEVDCEVRWSRRRRCGVQFLGPFKPSSIHRKQVLHASPEPVGVEDLAAAKIDAAAKLREAALRWVAAELGPRSAPPAAEKKPSPLVRLR
jgi:hypothetical protein